MHHRSQPHLCLAQRLMLASLVFASSAAAQYGSNVKVVNAIANDPPASCTALLNTLSSITGAGDANRFLVKIGPGKYDCGDQTLAMQPYVDVEGSGMESTLITGTGLNALVTAADDAELREMKLEVVADSTADDATGIKIEAASTRVTRVKLDVLDGNTCIGILNTNDPANGVETPYLRSLEIRSKCTGNSIGIDNRGNVGPVIQRVYVKGVNACGENIGIRYALAGVENQVRKEIRDAIISAYGVGPTTDCMDPVHVDPSVAFGIAVVDSFNKLFVLNAYINAGNGGLRNVGIASLDVRLDVFGSQINAAGTTAADHDFGISSDGGQVLVRSSKLDGDTAAIHGDNASAFLVGTTQLRGGGVLMEGGSTATCGASYGHAFQDLDGACLP
ncbi:MAG: hypothetical protein AAF657_21200 [Acidobacteriota bacterium]